MLDPQIRPGIHTSRHLTVQLARLPQRHADVLVIGGGIAGFSAALSAADAGAEVVLLQKDGPKLTNTSWAQGGSLPFLMSSAAPQTTTLIATCKTP